MTHTRHTILVIVTALTALLLGVFGTLAVQSLTAPSCPTEDSCTVDYHDGQWHVTEVTP